MKGKGMPEKDPTTWAIATWMLAAGMSLAGGLASFYQRYRRRHRKTFTLMELIGEVMTSAFVGVGTFMALSALDQPAGLCAAGAGIGGHMATRLMLFIEQEILIRGKGGCDD